MTNLNSVLIEGVLQHAPELLDGDEQRCRLTLALRTPVGGGPLTVIAEAYGKLANVCGEYLTEGRSVWVVGRLGGAVSRGSFELIQLVAPCFVPCPHQCLHGYPFQCLRMPTTRRRRRGPAFTRRLSSPSAWSPNARVVRRRRATVSSQGGRLAKSRDRRVTDSGGHRSGPDPARVGHLLEPATRANSAIDRRPHGGLQQRAPTRIVRRRSGLRYR